MVRGILGAGTRSTADGGRSMDKQKMMDFANHVYRDMAGTMAIGMAYLGQKNGMFDALAEAGPTTAGALAEKTGLEPRYVEEWLHGMTAAEWLVHDAAADTYELPQEHGFLVASEGTDHFMGGLFLAGPSLLSKAPDVAQAFARGGGVPFSEFDSDWIDALDLMNSGPYEKRLASYWIAEMPDIAARLEQGGRALDVGCGVGKVSLALARAYPKAQIVGFDPDAASVRRARETAGDLGNATFVEGLIGDIEAKDGFDIATLFDCLHDMADPVATLSDIRERLAPGGALMVMEPKAADDLADNINPLGAMYYGFSLFHCMTQSLAEGGPGHGTCMGPAKTMELLQAGGFSDVQPLAIKSQTNAFFAARV